MQALVRAEAKSQPLRWTLAESAQAGDLVVFYFVKPRFEFVGQGVVKRTTQQTNSTWRAPDGSNKPRGVIEGIRLFTSPVPLREAKKLLPAERWLLSPKGFARIRHEGLDTIIKAGRG